MSFWNSLRRSVTVDFIRMTRDNREKTVERTLLRERPVFLASRHHPESCLLVMKKHWRWTKLPSSAHFDLEKNHYVHVIIDRNTSSSATSATPDTSHNPILPHLLLFLIRSWASSFFLKNGYFDTDKIDGTIKKVIKTRNLLNQAFANLNIMCDKFSRSEEYRSNIQSMCPKKFRYWGRVGMSFWNSLKRSVTVDFIRIIRDNREKTVELYSRSIDGERNSRPPLISILRKIPMSTLLLIETLLLPPPRLLLILPITLSFLISCSSWFAAGLRLSSLKTGT